MKKHFICTNIFLFVFVFHAILLTTFKSMNAVQFNKTRTVHKLAAIDSAHFDVNHIACWLQNDGHIVSHQITGKAGLEWPKGSGKTVDYCSGLWLLGKLDNEIRTACTVYSSEFQPGPILPDGNPANPAAPEYRIYKINRNGTGDWLDWPFDQGAPALKATDGSDSLDANGNRIPFLIGDQTLWWVMNDLNPGQHQHVFATEPMGLEVQVTVFGFDNISPFDNMMFIEWKIINKSIHTYDNCFITFWDDPDLGQAFDDLVGCDTTLNLGFCYNDGPDSSYDSNTPASGFALLQGPVILSHADTARAFGQALPGYKNLPITAFIGSS